MRKAGDNEAGFEVAFDAATRTVRVDAWGFWGVGVAPRFRDTVLDACRGRNSATRLYMEMMRLKPLREEGEEAWLDILTKAPNEGIEGHCRIYEQLDEAAAAPARAAIRLQEYRSIPMTGPQVKKRKEGRHDVG
jgi:hypothetical protein